MSKSTTIITLFILFSLISNLVYPQDTSSTWNVVWLNKSALKDSKFDSKQLADSAIHQILAKTQLEGYLEAKVDTTVKGTTIFCDLVNGTEFKFKNSFVASENGEISKKNYGKYQELNAPIISSYPLQLIEDYENNGYPFVYCDLDSISQIENYFDSYWTLHKGPFIRIDSVIIQSEEKLPEQFIRNYLGIKKNQPYNEELIGNINKRIKELNFVEKKGNIEVVFRREGAKIYVPLGRKKANFFNAVIGVRPNDITGKINITGDVEIKLKSALNKGEDIYLSWKRLQPQTQNLDLSTEIPYLFKTPVGVNGDISIYRRDTTFSSTALKGGLFIYFSALSKVGIYIEQRQTTSNATLVASSSTNLFGGASGKYYGLKIQHQKLDYLYNPRRGYAIIGDFSVGNRNIINSESAPINARKQVYRMQTDVQTYIPTFKKQTIKLAANGAILDASSLFTNELYRIGGLRTIRGVDEESIFAQKWFVASLEYRFLLEENTALYCFVDQAAYVNYLNNAQRDTPLGFGLGLNFQTKTGIFTFNYALGQQFDNPILIRNAKISFGFQNIF